MPASLSTNAVRAHLAGLLPKLRARYGVRSLALFGSYARGEQTPQSDLSVLVEFDVVPGLFAFSEMQLALEDALGLRVDLFTRPMLKPRLAPRVAHDLVAV